MRKSRVVAHSFLAQECEKKNCTCVLLVYIARLALSLFVLEALLTDVHIVLLIVSDDLYHIYFYIER